MRKVTFKELQKTKAFADFTKMQSRLVSAQSTVEKGKHFELLTDEIFGMGFVACVDVLAARRRARVRNTIIIGVALTGLNMFVKHLNKKGEK